MTQKQNSCPEPKGILLIIGGKENKGENGNGEREMPEDFAPYEILETLVKLIKRQDPIIEVISTASGEAEKTFKEYEKVFRKLGVNNVHHIRHETRKDVLAEEPLLVERVSKAHAMFFTGGDQLKLTALYGGTEFLKVMKERYISDRIIIAGTSAGAMAMSTPMIFAGSKDVEELAGEIKITTGLEFLKDVCIDTHFVYRGRFVRMAQVIVTNPTSIGIGIEEDTALLVRNGVEAEVIGSGLVIVVEGFDIMTSNISDFGTKEKKAVTIKDLRVHILGSGEIFTIPQKNPPHK
jgi:cyanophycinase